MVPASRLAREIEPASLSLSRGNLFEWTTAAAQKMNYEERRATMDFAQAIFLPVGSPGGRRGGAFDCEEG